MCYRLLLSPLMIRQGHGVEWENFLQGGIACSSTKNDPAEIDFRLQLGNLYRLQGRLSEAKRCLQEALTLCEQSNLRTHFGALVNRLALVTRLLAQHDEALEYCQRVLAEPNLAKSEQAEALNVMGLIAYDRCQWEEALSFFEQALSLYRSLGSAYEIARILNNRGLVLRRSNRPDEAEASYREAIQYFEAADDKIECFKAVMNLGDIFMMRKDYHRAIQQFEEALPIFRQSNYTVDLAHTYNNLGMAYTGLEDWSMAEAYFMASIEIWRNLGDPYHLANVLDNLGRSRI